MSEHSDPSGDPDAGPDRGTAATTPLARSLALLLRSPATFTFVVLAAILVSGALLRFENTNWDSVHHMYPSVEQRPSHLHPDERHISMVSEKLEVPGSVGAYFDSETSRLNPYNQQEGSFVYGTLPVFMAKVIGNLTIGSGYDDITQVGRALSALFDTGTILLTFLIARRLYGRNAGLLAALLYAAAALPIQHSHFFVVDPFMTFFAALALYFAVRIGQDGGWANFAAAGAAVGLATACKLTAVSLMPVVGLAGAAHAWPTYGPTLRSWWHRLDRSRTPAGAGLPATGHVDLLTPAVLGLGLAILVGFLAFRLAQPYAFQTPSWGDVLFWNIRLDPRFVDDQINQQSLLSGSGAFPPSVQWIGRAKWLFPLQQMVLWGMGPAFGVAAWAGVVYAAWRVVFRREGHHLVPLAWVGGYFGFMGAQFSLYMRYFLPLYPALAVFGALLLVHLWRHSRSAEWGTFVRRWQPGLVQASAVAARALVVVVAVMAVLWGLAYANIYTRPHTRIAASQWIYENIDVGSAIALEHWDDALPVNLPGHSSGDYTHISMENYNSDSAEKVGKLLGNLDATDYVVLTSNRLYGSIPRIPAEYPVTSRYYELLLEEKLGFSLAAEFTSRPGVLGLEIVDDSAEESFTVYDHPKVLIFEKTPDFSRERAEALLDAGALPSVPTPSPNDSAQNALLLRPDDLEKQRSGGTFADLFDVGSFANSHPLLVWLLTIELLSFAALPAGLLLFRALPDRGYLLAKPLGFLVLSYLVWLGVSVRLFDFTRGAIAGALVLMVLAGLAVAYLTRARLIAFVREHWRAILLMEALFLAAFLAFYFIRLNNPDLWHPARGGEKPMDLAYLNAVTRSTTLPPYDPWMAGGYINYYYYGQFMTASLIKLTGIVPEVSYNLAVPLFFALTVGATFSVGYNLTEATRRWLRRRPGRRRIGGWTPVGAGLLAVVLVAVVGNLGGVDQMVDRLSEVSPWDSDAPLIGPVVGTLGGIKEVLFNGASLAPFDYWAPTRMMPPTTAITEFPFFTFVFADLHAHLMAIPFAITSLGMGLGLVLASTKLLQESPRFRAWLSWGLVIALALVIGALRWINSWDYPPFLLMALVALLVSERASRGGLNASAVLWTVVKGAAMVALSYALFLPFQRDYALPATGFHAVREVVDGEGNPEWSQFHQYLSHFGLLLFLIGSLLAFLGYRFVRRYGPARSAWALVGSFAAFLILAVVVVGMSGPVVEALPGPLSISGLSATDFLGDLVGNNIPVAAFALFGLAALGLLVWHEVGSPRPDGHVRLFVFGMVALALFLSAGVEVAALDEDIQRMNTVFKFYLHVWILLALASAFGVWYLLAAVRPQEGLLRRMRSLSREPRVIGAIAARSAFAVGLVVLLLAALIYPFFGLPERVEDRFAGTQPRTNDGMAYMQYATYSDEGETLELSYDYEAIRWVRENVDGSPPIMEGVTPEYRWGSRFSIYTGLPAVAGWNWHQRQQRGDFANMVVERQQDVEDFYSTTDVAQAQSILDRYDVAYVVVGQLERAYYPPEGIAKIEAGLGGTLSPVYGNEGTQIYRVAGGEAALAAAQGR